MQNKFASENFGNKEKIIQNELFEESEMNLEDSLLESLNLYKMHSKSHLIVLKSYFCRLLKLIN